MGDTTIEERYDALQERRLKEQGWRIVQGKWAHRALDEYAGVSANVAAMAQSYAGAQVRAALEKAVEAVATATPGWTAAIDGELNQLTRDRDGPWGINSDFAEVVGALIPPETPETAETPS